MFHLKGKDHMTNVNYGIVEKLVSLNLHIIMYEVSRMIKLILCWLKSYYHENTIDETWKDFPHEYDYSKGER